MVADLKLLANKFSSIKHYLDDKYYEVEDYTLCIILSMISRSNMIVLGQPGIAKTAILKEIVDIIDFSKFNGTPYFHVQMGSDISPNAVFGAPDIDYYKKHGIIKRSYLGYLPDAMIAFCSEFYRLNSQVANSGLMTILNEGEFKNGHDLIKTNLRFFMADTNFFPKPIDDIEADETDMKLQALHDRFLSRIYMTPLKEDQNKINMILMDDNYHTSERLSLEDIMYVQDNLSNIILSKDIAAYMVHINNILEDEHNIFISPRRLKQSRDMVKAHAFLHGRNKCEISDLIALKFCFWQKIEDIKHVTDVIYDTMGMPKKDAKKYELMLISIIDEMVINIKNTEILPTFDPDSIYKQALSNLNKLIDTIFDKYPHPEIYDSINDIVTKVEYQIEDVTVKRYLSDDDILDE